MPTKRTKEFYLNDDGDVPNELRTWVDHQCQLFAGERAVFSVERPGKSANQNRYLWGVVYPAVHKGFQDAGMSEMHFIGPDGTAIAIPLSVNTLHKWFKRKYLTPEEPGVEPSTKPLSMTEMHYYIESIRHDEAVRDLGIHVPQPDEPPIEAYE